MIAKRILAVVGMTVGVMAATAAAPAGADPILVIDDFESIAAWSAHPAEGVTLALASDAGEHGKALRMDVRFTHGTGYAVARRAVSLDLPSDYVFRFRMRGEIPNNALEFKLVDSTGNNVWWYVRRDLEFPHEWRTISTRKRQIKFAWGPAGGGEIRHVAAIEIAITAGEGGSGSVWLDDFTLEPLAPDSTMPPVRARVSSGQASNAVDGDLRTAWRSAEGDSLPWLELELGRPREFGGLDLRWGPGRHMTDYTVELSLDRQTWTAADTVRGSDGGRDPLYLPESEARFVRVRSLRRVSAPVELSEAIIQPLEWSATPEAYFTHLAKDAPRGTFPRPYVGEQCAWAVVGMDNSPEEALLSEDGMVETGKRQFSIEPFLKTGNQLITWADVRTSQSLVGGYWPEPSVQWEHPAARMTITCQTHVPYEPHAHLGYEVSNPGDSARHVTLYLAIRPFQVNPPWQNIGFPGGTARIHRIEHEHLFIRVNGDRGVICDSSIAAFGAWSFDDGALVECLRSGRLPAESNVESRSGFAAAVLTFELDLAPGQSKRVNLQVPLRPLPAYFRSRTAAITHGVPVGTSLGRSNLARVELILPREVRETLYAQLGWILVNRDSGAIQPGSRNYDRSWIRDGSLTSSALLRMELFDVVRDFIEWFAPFQYENGKIPCCASDRGPDPVTENDSHGEFIFLVAEYYRYTGDRAMVERMWPHIAAAVAHMDSLRDERRTTEWRASDKRKYFGLLLPSISHEGYPNPVHSYWDDFFAYRGYLDAVFLARVLERPEQARFAADRDTFAHDLAASVAAAMKDEHIDYVPGCAELGDFDATSTTVALEPTGAADLLPETAIRATFERYWKFFTDRRDGKIQWDAFTPYEMRVIGTFVRLGWRDRANQALDWFMKFRTPPGWRQWAEVAYPDPRTPKYIGDLPHTWVGSDFVRSVLDMLAYERGRDSSLVIGAGVPWNWIEHPDSIEFQGKRLGFPFEVVGLRTSFGHLHYSMWTQGDTVTVRVQEHGFRVPPGGILVLPPSRTPFRSATVNGKKSRITPEGGVVVRKVPAVIVIRP